MEDQIANDIELLVRTNATTKDDVLRRAKDALDVAEQCLDDATLAFAIAHDDFKATKKEIAKATDRSIDFKGLLKMDVALRRIPSCRE